MAGLIPQAFIDDLLSRADIVDVIDKKVPLKKTGKNYSACCPFHKEKTPSFSVQPERQFYYCFGCGAGGNALGFVMNYEQMDFPQAVESLARDLGLEVPREESAAATKKQSENAKLFVVLERSNKFYQQQLRQHENRQAAVDYLKARGVSGEIARDFQLGYAPPGWDNLLTDIGSDAGEQHSLFKAGMLIEKGGADKRGNNRAGTERGNASAEDKDKQAEESSNDTSTGKQTPHYYDRFRHRIIFPIRDSRGRTIAFGGRVLGDDKPKYLNSPETPVFHKGSELYGLYECKKSGAKFKRLLLVEGYMDVIALAQMGIYNAVATLGTATSTRHLTRMFRQVSEIVFCFDGDDAGRTAAWRALETTLPLMEDGRRVKFLFLPEGDDPDTLVREIGEAAFNTRVEQATQLEDFFFNKLSQDLDINSIEGKARLSNLAKPLIAKFPRGIYGQLMLDRLSETLGVSSESLSQLLENKPPTTTESYDGYAPMNQDGPPEYHGSYGDSAGSGSYSNDHSGVQSKFRGKSANKAGRGGLLDQYRKPASLKAIELMLHNPEVALSIKQDLTPLRTAEDESRKLLLSLIEMVRADPDTDTYKMLGYCYGTSLGNQLTQLMESEKITPTEGVEQEFNQILDSILSDVTRKLDLLKLKSRLKDQFPAQNSDNAQEPTDPPKPPNKETDDSER